MEAATAASRRALTRFDKDNVDGNCKRGMINVAVYHADRLPTSLPQYAAVVVPPLLRGNGAGGFLLGFNALSTLSPSGHLVFPRGRAPAEEQQTTNRATARVLAHPF